MVSLTERKLSQKGLDISKQAFRQRVLLQSKGDMAKGGYRNLHVQFVCFEIFLFHHKIF